MTGMQGKTVFITGASRGIGRAIALRCARDGANIVITAKTATPHPKLPGTIHEVADEVEAAGGKALAIQLDVRDDAAIAAAVTAGGSTFRRHRHSGQQCQCDPDDRYAGDTGEAF